MNAHTIEALFDRHVSLSLTLMDAIEKRTGPLEQNTKIKLQIDIEHIIGLWPFYLERQVKKVACLGAKKRIRK